MTTTQEEHWGGRREDLDLLLGRAPFVADLSLEGCLEAHFLRSTEAHGVLEEVDLSLARSLPGVSGAFAAGDLPDLPSVPSPPGVSFPAMDRPGLARERVRYAGEPVAVILADSRYLAEDAAEAAVVHIDPLPPVIGVDGAKGTDSAEIFPGHSNIAWEEEFGSPVEEVFSEAPVVVEGTFDYPRVAPTSLEGRAIAIHPDHEGRLTVWCSHQAPHRLRDTLAQALAIPPPSIRVIVPHVGGAFGGKSQTYPEYIVLAYLALTLAKPIRWSEDRWEALTAASHGRAQIHTARLAATTDGEILALEATIEADIGAYPQTGWIIPTFTAWVMAGPYRVPRLHAAVRASLTTAVPTTPYRGAGRPEAALTLEILMDRLARAVESDPVEIRLRNLLRPSDYPYLSPTGALYDSGDPASSLRLAVDASDYARWRSVQADRRSKGDARQIGIGIGCYVERSGGSVGSSEFGRVEVLPSGVIRALTGSTSAGQGHVTAFSILVAESLDIDVNDVEVIQGDTAMVARGTGSFASRSMQVGGAALVVAANKVLEEARARAADRLKVHGDDLVYADGTFSVAGTPATHTSLGELAQDGLLAAEAEVELPQAFPHGSYVAVVEVDIATGKVRVLTIAAADDCGKVFSPMIVDGQTIGSTVQGLGQVLMEAAWYSAEGQPLTGTLMDYLLPVSTDVPLIIARRTENENPNVPHGAKGAGEGGCIGAPPAIVNAIFDATSEIGADRVRLPLKPEDVRQLAIQGARAIQREHEQNAAGR